MWLWFVQVRLCADIHLQFLWLAQMRISLDYRRGPLDTDCGAWGGRSLEC